MWSRQAASGGLLEESLKDIVDEVFEVGEKPVSHVCGWRFVESAVVPDEVVWSSRANGRVS